VSQRLHDDFDNGKYYYGLNGRRLAYPDNPLLVPSMENLAYRYELFKEFEGSA
jgi:hypothetical protein